MTEVWTLKELGVGVGDVVGIEWTDGSIIKGVVDSAMVVQMYNGSSQRVEDSVDKSWRIKSRAAPKLWRDMTPEEKGALLLAAHDGKVIEEFTPDINGINRRWLAWYPQPKIMNGDIAYRIKQEPKVETVTLDYYPYEDGETATNMDHHRGYIYTHHITFNLIDGKPDCASVKMEEL